MPRALAPETREGARKLRQQGKSLKEIELALGISYGSARRFTKGVCPEKERSPEVGAKIAETKAATHNEWKRTARPGACGTYGCKRPNCTIDPGKCHSPLSSSG